MILCVCVCVGIESVENQKSFDIIKCINAIEIGYGIQGICLYYAYTSVETNDQPWKDAFAQWNIITFHEYGLSLSATLLSNIQILAIPTLALPISLVTHCP